MIEDLIKDERTKSLSPDHFLKRTWNVCKRAVSNFDWTEKFVPTKALRNASTNLWHVIKRLNSIFLEKKYRKDVDKWCEIAHLVSRAIGNEWNRLSGDDFGPFYDWEERRRTKWVNRGGEMDLIFVFAAVSLVNSSREKYRMNSYKKGLHEKFYMWQWTENNNHVGHVESEVIANRVTSGIRQMKFSPWLLPASRPSTGPRSRHSQST